MYTQGLNCLPSKNQTSFSGSLNQNLGLIRNFGTKSFPEFDNSPPHLGLGVDFKATIEEPNKDNISSRTANIMDFVCSFGESSGLKIRHSVPNCPITSGQPKQNCKDLFAHYNGVSTMQLASSHLVGGFVGSKSQLGRRPAHGFGVKMWDIIRELADLVGNSPFGVSSKKQLPKQQVDKKCTNISKGNGEHNSQITTCNNNRIFDHKTKQMDRPKCHRQSYAEVAKTKLSCSKPTKESTSFQIVENNKQINCHSVDSSNSKTAMKPPLYCSQSNSFNRDRITSECSADSEDSFIVFEYCDGSDDSANEDNSSDDESVLDFKTYEGSPSDSGSIPSRTFSFNSACKPQVKKVRFAEAVQVQPMVAWGFAYRAARRGPWETLARDSARFQNRIANTAAVLAPVLDPQHRKNVFQQRFSNSSL